MTTYERMEMLKSALTESDKQRPGVRYLLVEIEKLLHENARLRGEIDG